MTVSSSTRKAGPFNGNGVTTSFPFTFKVFAASDLQLTHTDSDGVETTLVLDTDYTVALNADQDNDPGGAITYPASGTDLLATGEKLTGLGVLASTQGSDITNAGRFNAQVFENALDKHTILVQQVEEKVGRALVVPVTESSIGTLPAEADRLGKYLAFDASGDPTASAGTGNDSALRTDLAASSGGTLVSFIAGITGAVARSVRDKLRDFPSIRDAGVDATGVTDCAATVAAIGTAPTLLPPGTYRLDSDVAGLGKVFTGLGGVKFTGTGKLQTPTAYGVGALANNTGFATGAPTLTDKNTGIGTRALFNNTTGYHNTAVGDEALYTNATGAQNTAVGLNALYYATGNNNVAVGTSAMRDTTTGTDNVAVGRACLFGITTAQFNVGVGRNVGWQKTVGDKDTAIGAECWWDCTTGSTGENTFVGFRAGYHWSGGAQNTVIGTEAGYAQPSAATYSFNTFLGYRAAFNTTSSQIVAIGWQALFNNTTGLRHTATGYRAGYGATTGTDGTFLGWQAGLGMSGNGTTAIGSGTGPAAGSTGNSNVIVGQNAGNGLVGGGTNVIVGASSAQNLTSGNGNTVIGYNVGVPVATNSDQIVIGSGGTARATFDNTRWLFAGDIRPGADNTYAHGSSGTRFTDSFALQFRPGSGAPIWSSGAGSPEGVLTAPIGSLYTRTDGGAGTTLYVKETGSGDTGWVGK